MGYHTPEKNIVTQMTTDVELSAASVLDRTRSNHTGTQPASTISDFADTVRGTLLNGLATGTAVAILATDSFMIAFQKLQAQIAANIYGNGTKSVTVAAEGAGTNSTTTYQLKVTLATDTLVSGATYLLHLYFKPRVTAAGQGIDVALFDTSTLLVQSDFYLSSTADTGQRNLFMEVIPTSTASKTLTAQFRVTSAGLLGTPTVYMSGANLSFRRIK